MANLSGRGGARTNGGRPSTWKHGPTCTVRVPEEFKEVLLKIAQNLDQCQEDTLVVDLKKLKIYPQSKKETVNLYRLPIFKQGKKKLVDLANLAEVFQAHSQSES